MAEQPELRKLFVDYARLVGDSASAAKPGAARGARRSPGAPELEARFVRPSFEVFAAVLAGLNEGEAGAGPGAITQVVTCSSREDPLSARRRDGSRDATPNLVRIVEFRDGVRVPGDRYYRKARLADPVSVRNKFALAYRVALSTETEADDPGSDSLRLADKNSVLRAKLRVSYMLGWSWRADLTVVREIRGSDAGALPGIVKVLFQKGLTPDNLVSRLGLGSAAVSAGGPGGPSTTSRRVPDVRTAAAQQIYRYEIELEYVGRKAAAPSEDAEFSARFLTDLAGTIMRLANPGYVQAAAYQEEVYQIARVVAPPGLLSRFESDFGFRQLTRPVKSLTRVEYKAIYPPVGYWTTDKADGFTAFASARGGRLVLLADKLYEVPPPPGVAGLAAHPAGRSGSSSAPPPPELVVAGELEVTPGVEPPEGAVLRAYDVAAIGGRNIAAEPYETRLGFLAAAVEELQRRGLRAEVKAPVHLSSGDPEALRLQFAAVDPAKRPYPTDGRLLVRPGATFGETETLKWKSARDTTIDFYVRRPPRSVLDAAGRGDAPGHELYYLFVGISPDVRDAFGLEPCPGYAELFREASRCAGGAYAPIQFSPSGAPYAYLYQHPTTRPEGSAGEGWVRNIEGQIVEFRCGGDCAQARGCVPKISSADLGDVPAAKTSNADLGGACETPPWEIVRVRTDRARDLAAGRAFGNDFRVAELTWLNYVDPFTEEMLWEGPGAEYFQETKSPIYSAPTAFTSYVKSQRIESLLGHADWVVDLGVGRGQDLGRYLTARVRHLVGVDRDRGALSELVQRKYSHADARNRGRGGARGAMVLYAIAADVGAPHLATAAAVRGSAAGFPDGGADAVVANLFLHYLAGSTESLANFAALCRSLVRVGGHVVVTAVLGDRVFELLEKEKVPQEGAWTVREGGQVKYSIRRDYAGAALTAAGQQVGVVHPFSRGEYYPEFLLNPAALGEAFTRRGFALVASTTLPEHLSGFRARNPGVAARLTPDDLRYLALYGELVYRRIE